MVDNSVPAAAVLESLAAVNDPEIGRSLIDLDMVSQITSSAPDSVTLQIELPTPAYPQRERISEAVQAAVQKRLPEVAHVDVAFTWKVKGKGAGGSIGLRCKNVIAVGSGKGGVGKSMVAASLAYGLSRFGAQVGLMDADVYGPSIPHIIGASGQPAMVECKGDDGQIVRRIEPIKADDLKVMSMGFLVPAEEAVVWRGPMLHGAITQFLKDTDWGELDYLIIDLPPGTGDVVLTLSQLLGLAGAIVVCTPQQVALLDAIKALKMFQKVKIPVLGFVENMTGEIFGRGGAQQAAAKHGVPFLGEIPIESQIRVQCDDGNLNALFAPDSPVRPHLTHICEQVAVQIVRTLMETPSMPTLEML